MPRHDFSDLESHYAAIIDQMPDPFTSHKFILALAQQNQQLYIEALYAYRKDAAPFQTVHGVLAKALHRDEFPVDYTKDVDSRDIWGHSQRCAEWERR